MLKLKAKDGEQMASADRFKKKLGLLQERIFYSPASDCTNEGWERSRIIRSQLRNIYIEKKKEEGSTYVRADTLIIEIDFKQKGKLPMLPVKDFWWFISSA